MGSKEIAFVFAGQGAQYPGMGQSIYEASPAARTLMDRAERIRPGTLMQCFLGDQEELNQTINTQPCLFLVDFACAVAAQEAGFEPARCAGFSLGELAAAAFSGALRFDEAFKLVIKRAALMQKAAEKNPGKMAAVLRLSAEQVEALAREFNQVYPVNYNCPGQTVVACAEAEFDAFCAKVQELRGRAVPLAVSGAFHSPFMRQASEGLAEYLSGVKINSCAIPLYSNVTGKPYAGDYRQLLSAQVQSPVLWQKTMENMRMARATIFVELGAGTTLSGFIKKTIDDAIVYNVADADSLARLQAARSEGIL